MKNKFKKEYFKVRKEYLRELNNLKEEKGLKNIERFKEKAYWAWNYGNITPQLHISFGNLKLPKTTCIINLGTWFNCSGRKEGFCDICEVCYDKSPEVRFKERTKGRLEQEIYWRSVDAKTFAHEVIKQILNYNKANKKLETNLIRWAEVGEIRNQKDLEKIIECSNLIYHTIGIKSYIYTHNQNLNFNIERPYLTINGSNFMVDNEYKVVKNKQKVLQNDTTNSIKNCICDCNNCSYCSTKNGYRLVEELR